MIDSPPSARPAVAGTQGNWLFRGLAQVMRSTLSFAPDPALALLQPDGAAGHSVRAVAVPLPDGHAMPGYLFRPRGATGATVALVHGVGAEAIAPYFMWIRAMLGAGLQVLTFELDGHGSNPRELCFPGIDDNLPAAVAFLRAQPEVDPERIGLMGVSLGGACVLNALPRLDGIGAAVIVSTPHQVAIDPIRMHLEALGVFNPELLPVVCFEASCESLLGFLTRPLRWGAAHAPGPLDFLDPRIERSISQLIAYLDPLAAAKVTTTPSLYVYGEWDQLAPAWQARELHAAAAGPKALRLAPRRNHLTVMADAPAIRDAVGWMHRWL